MLSVLDVTLMIRKLILKRYYFWINFFAGMLVLHKIIAVYAYFAMESLYALELLPYFLVVHLAELAGIAVLLKVTL
ncbi:MAG TPA: hypothetical protein VEL70_03675 [Candidatus Acidoferrum sp.]|nr:hypothetical protein [Candidatus Acidoferrum sp.]